MMRLDHDLVKTILTAFEDLTQPYVSMQDICEKAGLKLEDDSILYHFEIINDLGLITRTDGKSGIGVTLSISGEATININVRFRLTSDGHEYLRSISKPQIWEKLKKAAGDLGLSTMKESAKVVTQVLIKSQIESI